MERSDKEFKESLASINDVIQGIVDAIKQRGGIFA